MTSAMPRGVSSENRGTYKVDIPYSPKPGEEPFYMRAKKVFDNTHLDRSLRETLAERFYQLEFLSHEHNRDVEPVKRRAMAEQYARVMMTDLRDGKL